MKRTLFVVLLSLLILSLAACTGNPDVTSTTNPTAQVETDLIVEADEVSEASNNQVEETYLSSTPAGDYSNDDLNTQDAGGETTSILMEGNSINLQGSGAEVNGSVVTITAGGTYQISGSLNDGQVIVDSADEETVHLLLNGADITSSSSAPIYVLNAEKTVITLVEGTENMLTDGDSYQLVEEDEPNAALFSKDDLTINGMGSLIVYGNYNHGIVSKDDLKIVSGSITIQAVNDGIKGRDSITILNPVLNITAGGDGMQSNNEEDPKEGIVLIEGGDIKITAGQDGIQAQTTLSISGGDFLITSGGGSANGREHWEGMNRGADFGTTVNDSGESAKGLKAGVLVTITGGYFQVDSADDTIHSNDTVTISDGDYLLTSGDDGIHADTLLEIRGGDLILDQSYEGIESSEILISGGNLHLIASDDGINGSSGSGEGGMGGFGGFGGGDSSLSITGGTIFVDAGGDGIDINGSITMSDGIVLVNGPTNNGNGALDYLGEFNISGGILVAVGSAGMAQAPSQTSSQYSLIYGFGNYFVRAGIAFNIKSASGESILTFVPTKEYQTLVISTPDLVGGETYQLSVGGTTSGSLTDGFSTENVYSEGNQVDTITLSGMVTTGGSVVGGMMGAPGGGGGRPHGGGN